MRAEHNKNINGEPAARFIQGVRPAASTYSLFRAVSPRNAPGSMWLMTLFRMSLSNKDATSHDPLSARQQSQRRPHTHGCMATFIFAVHVVKSLQKQEIILRITGCNYSHTVASFPNVKFIRYPGNTEILMRIDHLPTATSESCHFSQTESGQGG